MASGAACEHVFVTYRPPDRPSYSYLLGHVPGRWLPDAAAERCKQLVIALDAGYPEMIEECWVAMTLAAARLHVR